VATGREETNPEGEWATHHVGHFTLEPHVGLSDFMEIGMYLQTAIRPDGPWDWAGFKLRAKVRLPEQLFGFLRLALNGELSVIPKRYEAGSPGGELRPIVQGDFGPLQLLVNPILGLNFSNGFHPDLEPCARAGYRVNDWFGFGAEYYSALGPIDEILPASEQTHRGFGTLDFFTRNVDVNFGVGGGTGDDSVLVKAIVTLHRAK
jgi:hypothetical protein